MAACDLPLLRGHRQPTGLAAQQQLGLGLLPLPACQSPLQPSGVSVCVWREGLGLWFNTERFFALIQS